MANVDVTLLEADGITQETVVILGTGRQSAVNSKSIALSSEDSTNLASVATALGTTALDLGSGSSGTRTLRTIIDTSQLAELVSSSRLIASGAQVVTLVTDVNVPVTGTFWQATQPVSGTFWQATQPVSGTFWQATQPVSGTFWQSTQSVSNTGTFATQATAGGSEYQSVAASQTDAVLGSTTGVAGDYIECLICVVSSSPGSQVQIKDGAGSAITVLPSSVGAGVNTYTVPMGIISTSSGWKVTTGSGVSVIATGRFT